MDWSSRMIHSAKPCVVHFPAPIYSGSLDTSSVPCSNDVVISILFVYISVFISRNLIHFILLQ